MKKIIITLLVLIFLISASVLLFNLISKNKWKTYNNSRYGFSVDYPAHWKLGEPEFDNAGRIIKSPESDIECYIYGFANALLNEQSEPQTLNEFINWLTTEKDRSIKIIEQKETKIDNRGAVYLLTQEDAQIKQSVYALGKETGIGFFCIYKNLNDKEKHQNIFNKMVASIKIFSDLDGEQMNTGIDNCRNLLSGAIEPLKDLQTFEDEKYPEVTMTSREYWDKNRLPRRILDLEKQGYRCDPQPIEFNYPDQEGDYLAQPEVKKVRWQCGLNYQEWHYLTKDALADLTNRQNQGFICQKQNCINDENKKDYVWLCSK